MTRAVAADRPALGALYVVGRSGRAGRRRAEGQARRRLLALRVLSVAWAVLLLVLLRTVVAWCGWSVAALTHTPMLALLVVLVRAVRVERRWLLRLSAAAGR